MSEPPEWLMDVLRKALPGATITVLDGSHTLNDKTGVPECACFQLDKIGSDERLDVRVKAGVDTFVHSIIDKPNDWNPCNFSSSYVLGAILAAVACSFHEKMHRDFINSSAEAAAGGFKAYPLPPNIVRHITTRIDEASTEAKRRIERLAEGTP